MKHRLGNVFAAALGAASFSVIASPALLTGPQATLGGVSSPQTLLSVNVNPAAGQLVLQEKSSFRWSYLNGPALGFELADIDNVVDEYDLLSEEIDVLDAQNSITVGEVEALADQFDDFLLGLSDDPVFLMDAEIHLPGLPLVFRSESLKGVVSIDASVNASAGVQIIGDTIRAEISGTDVEVDTNTALRVFLGTLVTTSVGYSHDLGNPFGEVKSDDKFHLGDLQGRLLVGGKLNLYKVTLVSQIEGILNDDEEDEEDFSDSVFDSSEENEDESSNFGLDLGALWVADYYQVGMTWKNINEPDFDVPDPSSDCAARSGSDFANCVLAGELEAAGRVDFDSSFTMENQLTAEVAMTSQNKHWVLASAFDLNEVESISGNENQWLSLSASYFSDSGWIPSARLGFRQNLAGSELSFAGAGVTLFGGINVDVGMALESIDIDGEENEEGELDDGDSIPRALYISVGVEHKF